MSPRIVPVERMDVPQMIARAQYWTGWCVDNEINDRELTRLRYLLQAVTAHLQDERDATLESGELESADAPGGDS